MASLHSNNLAMTSAETLSGLFSSDSDLSQMLDLTDQAQLEQLLAGTTAIHLKQYLFKQKFADRDVDAKSDCEAAKWRKRAEEELRNAADGVGQKATYRALVCYNLAIAYADPYSATAAPSETECELSTTYRCRGELYLNQLSFFDLGVRDLERAIVTSCSPNSAKLLHFLLLEYLLKQKDRLADNCTKALQLVCSIEDTFGDTLNAEQKTSLAQFREVLEHQAALKSLNTINYGRKTLLQSLKSTRMPTLVEKDRPLVEKLLTNPEMPLAVLADSVHCADRLFKVKETRGLDQSQLVLLEQAFAYVATAPYSHCAACLVPLHFFGALPCRACSGQLYCGEMCEGQHWDTFHQFECGNQEKLSIWNRLDALGQLTVRLLIRFGNNWAIMVDSIRELICDKVGRFNNKVQFEAKKALQLRALLDWFMDQGDGSLKMSMSQFVNKLGPAFGVYSLLEGARDPAKSSLILPEYRAKLLHGIILCRIVLETAQALGIVGPVMPSGFICEQQQLRPFSVRDRVAKLVGAEASGDSADLAKIWQELIEQEFPDSCDLAQDHRLTASAIGLALYPSSVFLRSVASQSEVAPNGTVLYSGVYRAIRTLRLIPKDYSIQVLLPKAEGFLERGNQSVDDKAINQLAQNYVNGLVKTDDSKEILNRSELDAKQKDALNFEMSVLKGLVSEVTTPRPIELQVAFWLDMSRVSEEKADFREAISNVAQCLELTKPIAGDRAEKLRQALMVRLCRMQFELFTEKDLSTNQSTKLADHCLVNCSQVAIKLERSCLPLRIHRALLYAKQNPQAKELTALELSEQLIAAEGISCLIELEEMMVAANMYSQKFQPGAFPAGAAS